MKRILITGSTSFLGKKLGEKILQDDTDLHVTVRDSSKKDRLPNGLSKDHIHHYKDHFESLAEIIGQIRPSLIYNIASFYAREASPNNLDQLVESNLLFGLKLLEAIKTSGVKASIVNFGSYNQYYQNGNNFEPLNVYSALKNSFFEILKLYSEQLQFNYINLILFDSYGKGDWRNKLLPTIRKSLLSGESLRLPDPKISINLSHIDDIVDGALAASVFTETDPKEKTYFLPGDEIELGELISLVEKIINKTLPIEWHKFGLPKKHIINPWVGITLPGWKREVKLWDGLNSYLNKTLRN